MSALRTHLEGDCWSPCHYCLLEDSQESESDTDTDEDDE